MGAHLPEETDSETERAAEIRRALAAVSHGCELVYVARGGAGGARCAEDWEAQAEEESQREENRCCAEACCCQETVRPGKAPERLMAHSFFGGAGESKNPGGSPPRRRGRGECEMLAGRTAMRRPPSQNEDGAPDTSKARLWPSGEPTSGSCSLISLRPLRLRGALRIFLSSGTAR